MTNKLVVIINSLKLPKIKKILLYELKFLVSNYSCLQNPRLGGYRPQIPVLSVLCPQLNLLNPPPRTKFEGSPLVGLYLYHHHALNVPAFQKQRSPKSGCKLLSHNGYNLKLASVQQYIHRFFDFGRYLRRRYTASKCRIPKRTESWATRLLKPKTRIRITQSFCKAVDFTFTLSSYTTYFHGIAINLHV